MRVVACVFTVLCCIKAVVASNSNEPGYTTWISDNLEEYEDVVVDWDDNQNVPKWLKGTYLKNGPARTEFGGEKRFKNLIDGWAKINKFQVSKSGIRFSSKFLKTPTYKKNVDAGGIVPQGSLGPIYQGGWGWDKFIEVVGNDMDNTAVTISRMGSDFIAATDLPKVNIFNVSTLEWKEFYSPEIPSVGSAAHWMEEPDTNNMINYHINCNIGCQLTLYRYPDGNLRRPEKIGKFRLNHQTMIHSFSVTPNYAIFFVYPIHISLFCAILQQQMQDMFECVKWEGDKKSTNVVIMSLKTGKVISSTNVAGFYGTHHINAYEKTAITCHHSSGNIEEGGRSLCQEGEPQVTIDAIIPPYYALKNFTDKQGLLDSVDTGSDKNLFQITRFTINIHSKSISSMNWEDFTPGQEPYYNQFDFPNINPKYRGKEYCYAYGQAILDNVRQPLIKKSICDPIDDRVWFKKNHYTGEPMFIPRPGATEEDDGVLLVVVLDGSTEKSYLLLLDGKTFSALATAQLPCYIPMAFHGNWFDGEFL